MKLLELQRRDENDEIQGSIEDLNQDINDLKTKVTKPEKITTIFQMRNIDQKLSRIENLLEKMVDEKTNKKSVQKF